MNITKGQNVNITATTPGLDATGTVTIVGRNFITVEDTAGLMHHFHVRTLTDRMGRALSPAAA